MEVQHTCSKDTKGKQASSPPPPQNSRRQRRYICLAVVAFILGVFLILLVLGLTVFKVKRPATTVHSIVVKDLQTSLDIPKLKAYLNISFDVNLSIKNKNKIGFKFTNSGAFLNYRGQVVGEVPIPAVEISADKTFNMDLTVTFMADRLLSDSDLYLDNGHHQRYFALQHFNKNFRQS
ncbi:hypothetical protein Vadar_013893 [Vaccinium darrowii]|uniref:Uncharacterized protein n=1 Tax=Vaccinium darrowii TaxID=229202 RepID=A0ACB7XQJ0_9ERIC|nr:hypothetical protein Vadar_013893 [Vaccinium darrowii]